MKSQFSRAKYHLPLNSPLFISIDFALTSSGWTSEVCMIHLMYVETHYAQLARALSSYLFKSKYTELFCVSNMMDDVVFSDNAFLLYIANARCHHASSTEAAWFRWKLDASVHHAASPNASLLECGNPALWVSSSLSLTFLNPKPLRCTNTQRTRVSFRPLIGSLHVLLLRHGA